MDTKIPTSNGSKTISVIIADLYYECYEHNRLQGMTHEALEQLGIGNERRRAKFDSFHFKTIV